MISLTRTYFILNFIMTGLSMKSLSLNYIRHKVALFFVFAQSFTIISAEIISARTVEMKSQYAAFQAASIAIFGEQEINKYTCIAVGEMEFLEFPILQDMVLEISKKLDTTAPLIRISIKPLANAFAIQLPVDMIFLGNDLFSDSDYALNYEELYAVISHEIAHLKHNHPNIRMEKKIKYLSAIFGGSILAWQLYKYKFGNQTIPNLLQIKDRHYDFLGKRIPFITKHRLIAYTSWFGLNRALLFPIDRWSRAQEKEADLTAKEIIFNSQDLINGLSKIHNLSHKKHGKIYTLLSNLPEVMLSHPKLKTRQQYLLN